MVLISCCNVICMRSGQFVFLTQGTGAGTRQPDLWHRVAFIFQQRTKRIAIKAQFIVCKVAMTTVITKVTFTTTGAVGVVRVLLQCPAFRFLKSTPSDVMVEHCGFVTWHANVTGPVYGAESYLITRLRVSLVVTGVTDGPRGVGQHLTPTQISVVADLRTITTSLANNSVLFP